MLFDAVDRIAAAVAVVAVVANRWWDGNGTFIMVHRDDDIIIIGNIMVRLVARLFLSFSLNYSISRRCNLSRVPCSSLDGVSGTTGSTGESVLRFEMLRGDWMFDC